jgi:hypothetical protein
MGGKLCSKIMRLQGAGWGRGRLWGLATVFHASLKFQSPEVAGLLPAQSSAHRDGASVADVNAVPNVLETF